MVDVAVRLAHAGQRETGHSRERAGGVDQIGDLPKPAFVGVRVVCLAHNILKLAQGRTPSLAALATG